MADIRDDLMRDMHDRTSHINLDVEQVTTLALAQSRRKGRIYAVSSVIGCAALGVAVIGAVGLASHHADKQKSFVGLAGAPITSATTDPLTLGLQMCGGVEYNLVGGNSASTALAKGQSVGVQLVAGKAQITSMQVAYVSADADQPLSAFAPASVRAAHPDVKFPTAARTLDIEGDPGATRTTALDALGVDGKSLPSGRYTVVVEFTTTPTTACPGGQGKMIYDGEFGTITVP